MSPEVLVSAERKKNLVGQPTSAVINEVVRRNPQIKAVAASRFLYEDGLVPRWVSRETILSCGIEGYTGEAGENPFLILGEGDGFVLMSRVWLQGFWPWGRDGYVPMIDFEGRPHLREKQKGEFPFWPSWVLFQLKRALRNIGQEEGVLVDSGGRKLWQEGSLHFWGFRIMDEERLKKFVEDLRQFPEIRIGPGENDVLRPDPSWVKSCGRPKIMNLRYTGNLLKPTPIVIATL